MEIRHQDIFPWNQLNIHILVVYSDAKLSIFGKKHSKVEESHQRNWITLQDFACAMVWDWSNLSNPFLILPHISLRFGTTYMQEDLHTSKSTQAQLVTWLFLLQDCLYAVKRRQKHNIGLTVAHLVSAVLLSYLEIPSNPWGSRGGNESGVASAHDSLATLHYLWGLLIFWWLKKLNQVLEKEGWKSLPLACDNAEEASSLEGQRRERELGKCQKWDTYTDTSHWI